MNILLFSCIAGFLKGFAQDKKVAVSAIAFYNLENLFDTIDNPRKFDDDFTPQGIYHYTDDVYKKKLHNIATVLAQLATDVVPDGPSLVGVAEIENEKVLQDLLHQPELQPRKWKIVHFESPDSRGIDVAMLYNPRYFKLIQAKALSVKLASNGRPEHTRDILYVAGKLGSDTVHVLVNHWPSRREGEAATAWKRAKAAGICKAIIDSITQKNPSALAIVMGDMNDDPVDPSIARTLGAQGSKNKVVPGGLYNPWSDFYRKGYGSLCYNDKWNLFDQIMVSYGFLNDSGQRWHYYSAEIFNRRFLKTTFGRYKGYPHRSFSGTRWIDGYSDHFPTIIYLKRNIE